MNRLFLACAVSGAMLACGAAEAQRGSNPPKKLYRWVDRDGKVQFSDALPPEAIDQARTELSNSGRVVADIDRALTPEERAAAEAAAEAAALAEAEAEKTRQTEEAMLASFATEEDLRRSVEAKVTLLQQTLDAIEAAIAGQRASLSSLLLQASERELEGASVNVRQAATIVELHREIGKQQQMMIVKQAELVDADRELDYLVQRFRELKAERAPKPPGAGTPEAAPAEATPADATPAG